MDLLNRSQVSVYSSLMGGFRGNVVCAWLSGFAINHLDLWKASIDVAKVADILNASPLCHERDRIPVREVTEALDIIRRVLQPTAVKHLVTTPGGTDSTPKPD